MPPMPRAARPAILSSRRCAPRELPEADVSRAAGILNRTSPSRRREGREGVESQAVLGTRYRLGVTQRMVTPADERRPRSGSAAGDGIRLDILIVASNFACPLPRSPAISPRGRTQVTADALASCRAASAREVEEVGVWESQMSGFTPRAGKRARSCRRCPGRRGSDQGRDSRDPCSCLPGRRRELLPLLG